MTKQTAVEWLVEQLRGYDDKGDFIFNGVITFELIEQAKEMHKEQMIAFAYEQIQEMESELGDIIYKKVPEEIYNETYGNKI
jgi:hypothetical protein